MQQSNLPAIRPMTLDDRYMIEPFFAQMSQRTRNMFNESNHLGLLACFEPEKYGKYAFGVRRNFIAVVPAEDGKERIAGLVFLWNLDTKAPYLGICIAEDWKGRHLGSRLINYAKDYCIAHNKGAVLLTTYKDNIEGQGLYKKSGFKQIGISDDDELLFLLAFPDVSPIEDGTV